MKKIVLLTVIMAPALTFSQIPKVIYGTDDRVEAREYHNASFREKAKSVAGMVSRHDLSLKPSRGTFHFFQENTLENMINLCPNEPFAQQTSLPNCTGFLVGPDTLVTAGHCITSLADCFNNVWVFDYVEGTTEIERDNVYNCREVLGQQLSNIPFINKDYAVIKLDRAVKNRTPLKFRTKGNIKKGADVLVIGHPSGLPLKIADNAVVMTSSWNTFRTNLDTYGGNSGSPVFNQDTGLVEGILIQGANDYIYDSFQGCRVSERRNNVRGDSVERVFRITKVKEIQ